MRFDEFIMERMGYPWGENEPDKQTRRQAFLVFRQRTGRGEFGAGAASLVFTKKARDERKRGVLGGGRED